MTLEVTGKRVLFALVGLAVVLGGVAYSLNAALQRNAVAEIDLHAESLRQPGNAPPAVQAEVRATLKAFQEGYVRRDSRDLEPFMSRLFERSDDVLILGAGPNELARGYLAASELVRRDWVSWGDFRFSADDAIVSSSGDVAWVVTAGKVRFKHQDRPVYFSAVLTREGNRWLFRQMNFRYGDRSTTPASLLLLRP